MADLDNIIERLERLERVVSFIMIEKLDKERDEMSREKWK